MIPTNFDKLSECVFQTFNLNRRDSIESKVLTDVQKMGINNERATIAKQLLDLTYDPLNPHQFGLDQAMLRGQLSVLTYLLESDESARAELLTLLQSGE